MREWERMCSSNWNGNRTSTSVVLRNWFIWRIQTEKMAYKSWVDVVYCKKYYSILANIINLILRSLRIWRDLSNFDLFLCRHEITRSYYHQTIENNQKHWVGHRYASQCVIDLQSVMSFPESRMKKNILRTYDYQNYLQGRRKGSLRRIVITYPWFPWMLYNQLLIIYQSLRNKHVYIHPNLLWLQRMKN